MFNRRFELLILCACLIGMFLVNVQAQVIVNKDEIKIPLIAKDVRNNVFSPEMVATAATFQVDQPGNNGVFDILLSEQNATASLILPNNVEVNANNAAALGYTYNIVEPTSPLINNGLSPFSLIGRHAIIQLSASSPTGAYQIKVSTVGTINDCIIISTFYSSSPIRAYAVTNSPLFRINDAIVVSAAVFNGSAPVNNATVTAVLDDPTQDGFTPLQISLQDSGPNDYVAGDGIYTGTFTASGVGRFNIGVEITGTTSTGVPFSRFASTQIRVIPNWGRFTTFSDIGVDSDSNGKFDSIEVTANINVQTAGKYFLSMILASSNGSEISAREFATLSTGSQQVKLPYKAVDILKLGANGPYTMKKAVLSYQDDPEKPITDYRENAGQTQAYSFSSFQRTEIVFTGQPALFEEDFNGNGKIDRLRLQTTVEIPNAGNYRWSAVLVDPSNREIEYTIFPVGGSGPLPAGTSNINFAFDGRNISRVGLNGPYTVRKAMIYGEGKLASLSNVLTTRAFLSTDFEQPIVLNCANITASLPAGQTSGPVNYTLPTASFNTFITNVSCLPAPGASFAVGSTQVNCTATENLTGYTANCSFTLTVNNQADTTPPTITCPVNVYGVIPYGSGSGPVSYPAPVVNDDRAGVTFSCSQPSGSNFFRGATTVTCTATDAAGNQASCNFTVRVFDVSLQDNQLKHTLWFDSVSGDYYFFSCDASGYTLAGKGTITRQGCNTMLGGDPRVSATFTACVATPSVRYGNAIIKPNPVGGWFYITDSDANTNLPSCPIG